MKSITRLTVVFLLMLYIGPMILAPSFINPYMQNEPTMNKDFQIASVGWYDASFQYRKSVTINGSAGAGTDYQVFLNVLYDPDMQTDFDDVRFTDDDGITELDYWMEYYNPAAATIELADYGEISDESSSPDYIFTNVKDGNAFNETSATDIEIWFEVDTTNGFEGFSYAHYLYASGQDDCVLGIWNFDTTSFDTFDSPLPTSYDWMNGSVYDPDYWNTTHIAFQLTEIGVGTADFYWDYGEITHSKTARFWVNVTDNLDTDQTIYMYYGNEAVSTTSNGTATFLMYEDWSSQSVRAAVWDIGHAAGSQSYSAVDANHGYTAKIEANAGGASYLVKTDYTSSASMAVMFRSYIEDCSAGNFVSVGSGHIGDFGWARVSLGPAVYNFDVYDDDGNDDPQALGAGYEDTWVTWGITRDGTNAKLYVDTALIETASFDPDAVGTNPAFSYRVIDSEEDLYSDWILVRKFIAIEPEFDSFGEEETDIDLNWEVISDVELLFIVLYNMWGYDTGLIILGLIMIPTSSLYLVKGGRKEMSSDKLFYALIIFFVGCGLFIGGVLP